MYQIQLTPAEFDILEKIACDRVETYENLLVEIDNSDDPAWSMALKMAEAKKNGPIVLQVVDHISTDTLSDPDDIPMSDGGAFFYVSCQEGFWSHLVELTGNEDAACFEDDRHHFTFNREAVDYEEAKNAVLEYMKDRF